LTGCAGVLDSAVSTDFVGVVSEATFEITVATIAGGGTGTTNEVLLRSSVASVSTTFEVPKMYLLFTERAFGCVLLSS
jgi:hypothetical protein